MNDLAIACYAGDNTLYKAFGNFVVVAENLRMSAAGLFEWFKDNQIKDNKDRFHLILIIGGSNQIQIGNSSIKSILCENRFAIKFDHKLAFDQNVRNIY